MFEFGIIFPGFNQMCLSWHANQHACHIQICSIVLLWYWMHNQKLWLSKYWICSKFAHTLKSQFDTPWHYIVPGYSRVAKYFIWILIPFCAFGHGTHVHIPVPLKHFALLCPECRLMDWVSFNSFSLSCPECRLLQGCRLIFLGYLPWVSFITWVSSIRESRVVKQIFSWAYPGPSHWVQRYSTEI